MLATFLVAKHLSNFGVYESYLLLKAGFLILLIFAIGFILAREWKAVELFVNIYFTIATFICIIFAFEMKAIDLASLIVLCLLTIIAIFLSITGERLQSLGRVLAQLSPQGVFLGEKLRKLALQDLNSEIGCPQFLLFLVLHLLKGVLE